MKNISTSLKRFVRNEEGLTTVEYAVAGALITVAVVGAFTLLGGAVGTSIGTITTALG